MRRFRYVLTVTGCGRLVSPILLSNYVTLYVLCDEISITDNMQMMSLEFRYSNLAYY